MRIDDAQRARDEGAQARMHDSDRKIKEEGADRLAPEKAADEEANAKFELDLANRTLDEWRRW